MPKQRAADHAAPERPRPAPIVRSYVNGVIISPVQLFWNISIER